MTHVTPHCSLVRSSGMFFLNFCIMRLEDKAAWLSQTATFKQFVNRTFAKNLNFGNLGQTFYWANNNFEYEKTTAKPLQYNIKKKLQNNIFRRNVTLPQLGHRQQLWRGSSVPRDEVLTCNCLLCLLFMIVSSIGS
ncbi:hypothetical protein HELRODRAFT_161172 [Helobdella robusta]|uniref:Uncharacterized protein n=1 Tax=Helobdella robusta TaxID=6412 RepID=T1ER66_HELRO|nr:hypothetical protein HELRODRAFT_161172 [Helobdella robusta]ESO01962.1 hypothetical protein HELRODRAFT_161172 [Helobdella robusta]